jgi:hypothetical protein
MRPSVCRNGPARYPRNSDERGAWLLDAGKGRGCGLDPTYARVVVTRYVNDDLAEVELETNTPEAPYPYFVQVDRINGRWFEGSSGNGPSYPEAEAR